MGLSIFTLIHIIISLADIVSGLVVLGGWLAGKQFQGWTAFFLVHSDDECQRVLFPIPQFNPGLWGGRNLALCSGGGDIRPLFASALKCLEQGIRYQRPHGSLSEFFCPGRTALPKNSRLEGARANPN
jgi:hypothetical protein